MFSVPFAAKFCQLFPRPSPPHIFSAVKYWMALSAFATLACFRLPSPLNLGRPFFVRACLIFLLPLKYWTPLSVFAALACFWLPSPLNSANPSFVQARLIFSLPLKYWTPLSAFAALACFRLFPPLNFANPSLVGFKYGNLIQKKGKEL